MYLLMNKNNIVATFDKKPESELSISTSFKVNETLGKLPYGFDDINTWLECRKSLKHNKQLTEIMKRLGCYYNEGFIRKTHAATINDTFWVKTDTEQISWEQISLYRNQFTEAISKLAFKGVGLYDAVFSSTSPELACEGSFRKCFRKEAEIGEWRSDIFIYKRGSEGVFNAGLEPYCEVLSSEIAQIICPNAVSYELTRLHGKLASRCNLFTDEKYGYVPFAKLDDVKKMNFEDVFLYFIEHGAEQQFREMLVLDALCFNEDRHAGNFGMMFNNDTMELVKMSPIFDLNISLLAHVKDAELSNIGDVLYARTPVFGDDFTRMGQIACNDTIRERVKDIKDFTFKFRGDDVFSPERVHILENIVRKQAEAILSTDKLFTKDVFISQKELEFTELKKASNVAFLLMETFEAKIREPLSQRDYFTSRCGEIGNVQCFVKNLEGSFEMAIDFLNGSISIRLNGWIITPEKLKEKLPQKYTIYQKIINELQAFMREKQDERFNLSVPSFREICEAAQEEFYDANGYYPTSEEAVRLTDEARAEIAREKEERK